MKPYYEENGITIYNADCREVLPSLSVVDLVLTDPPYGVGVSYLSFNDTPGELKELAESMPLILRSAKRALLTVGHDNIFLYPKPDWILCWYTPAGANQNRWGFTCWQPILAYGKDPYRAAGMGARPDVINHTETAERNGHPCPKPIGAWKKILSRGSAYATDVILDPFMGSGTTLRAAKDLGRKAIGIEIEERYCEIAANRLRQEVLQFEVA